MQLTLVCFDNCFPFHFYFNSSGPKCFYDIAGDTYKPISANSFMMDLHLELIQAQHRIAVMLLDQLQGSSHQSK
jgi:hypothetical protein